jgi:type IV pilus assembly protein PilA
MQETLRRARKKRATGDQGFTLIELLVVVVIIGVLVGIAVPVYLNYRKGAENKSAQSDVRGAISAVEQFYTENGNSYPDTGPAGAKGANLELKKGTAVGTVAVSSGNQLQFQNNSTSYVICGMSSNGKVYVYDSSKGGSVKESSKTTLDACVTSAS